MEKCARSSRNQIRTRTRTRTRTTTTTTTNRKLDPRSSRVKIILNNCFYPILLSNCKETNEKAIPFYRKPWNIILFSNYRRFWHPKVAILMRESTTFFTHFTFFHPFFTFSHSFLTFSNSFSTFSHSFLLFITNFIWIVDSYRSSHYSWFTLILTQKNSGIRYIVWENVIFNKK